jgi:hypothetical protein
MRLTRFALIATVIAGCAKEGADTTAQDPNAIPAPVAPTEAPAPPISEQPAFVTATTTLRRSASEDKKVADPQTNKQVANYLTTLLRGEQVTMLEQRGEYMKVRASDESQGFVKSDSVLPATGVTLATNLEELKTFSRPDFSALNTQKMLPVGQLLFVTKTKEPFSEVNFAGDKKLWLLTEKLSSDSNEVEASRLVNRARSLEERKDPSAKEFWELAKSKFGTTLLVQQLSQTPTANAGAPEPTVPPTGAPN